LLLCLHDSDLFLIQSHISYYLSPYLFFFFLWHHSLFDTLFSLPFSNKCSHPSFFKIAIFIDYWESEVSDVRRGKFFNHFFEKIGYCKLADFSIWSVSKLNCVHSVVNLQLYLLSLFFLNGFIIFFNLLFKNFIIKVSSYKIAVNRVLLNNFLKHFVLFINFQFSFELLIFLS